MRRQLRSRRRPVRRKRQKGGFLNRSDFAYAGRDTINQAFKNLDKSAPPLINNLSAELSKILEQNLRSKNRAEQNLDKSVQKYSGELSRTPTKRRFAF